jgi:[ribosomal protein S18]-alanine N-acetyltransferase
VVGYICPMQVLDEGHILNVAVDPDCRGMGVGRALVQRVLDDFRASGAAFVSLEVRVSNVAAICLYRQMGFAEVGRRKRYYENGEDALMMEYLC